MSPEWRVEAALTISYLETAPPDAEILRTAQVPVQCSSATASNKLALMHFSRSVLLAEVVEGRTQTDFMYD